jgi:hypothetical protein
MVMAQIYTIVGEYDLAMDELDYVLSIPSMCTPALLRSDPLFAPMQELPRFVALLEKYDT